MAPSKDLDSLDRSIILQLQEDARRPYKDIASKLNVSEGTVKNRVTRLVNRGVLKLEARVNPFALPHKISALVGVNLKNRDYEETMREIEKIPEITSVWSATGRFDLFFEIMANSLDELYGILYRKEFKEIESITYTETHVTLSSRTKFYKLS